jgi:hypothetical protein
VRGGDVFKRLAVLLIVFVVGFVVVPSPASAEPNPPNCPREYFCAYSGTNQSGSLLLRTAGNWSGSIGGVRSVFNNGVPWPGADHVQLTYRLSSGPVQGSIRTRCIHYNPGPGQYKVNFDATQLILRVVWRGEC